MTDTNPSPGRRILQYITGFIAGAIMGILILAAVLTLMLPFYLFETKMNVLYYAILGFVPSILLGGAMGLLFIRLLRRATRPRRFARIGASLYIATIAAGFPIVLLLQPLMDVIAHETRLYTYAHSSGRAAWKQVYVNRYPYNETSLAEVLGPLRYPGARLESWEEAEGYSGWDILTITDDSPDQVLAFYASVLRLGIEGYPNAVASGNQESWSTKSHPFPSIDNLAVSMTLEGGLSGMRIRFNISSIYSRRYTPSEGVEGEHIVVAESVPWPENHESYLEEVRGEQQRRRDRIARTWEEWIYPGATFAWGDLGGQKQMAYETYDSVEEVLEFYKPIMGEARFTSGQYRFPSRGSGLLPEYVGSGLPPEFTIYPVGDKVRIHFVCLCLRW